MNLWRMIPSRWEGNDMESEGLTNEEAGLE